MSQRHSIQAGFNMLVTTNTKSRRPIFSDPACARVAVETLYQVQEYYAFSLFGFVIMPDHCHLLLQIPEGGSISKLVGIYKRAVSFKVGMGSIWQPRFHIMYPKRLAKARHYVHQNPVKQKLCEFPELYSWSSASGRWDVLDLE